jgi:dihydroorotate dehydrogenase
MTPQEAYNKGLDVAENEAYQKLSNALQGVNDTPFINPKMEELRLKILQVKKQKPVKVQIIEKKIENISSENMEYILKLKNFHKNIT